MRGMVALMDTVTYAKQVAKSAAVLLIATGGDADAALARLAEIDAGAATNPEAASIACGVVAQAIREAREMVNEPTE